MTADQIIPWIERLGIAGVFALMWWFERQEKLIERKERMRMQAVVESFLPVMQATTRVQQALHRVVAGGDEDA